MRKAENKNAPMLSGWVIAAAAGLVAFGVLVLVGKFGFPPAVAIAGVVTAVVGPILGMSLKARAASARAAACGLAQAADVAKPAAPAPVMATAPVMAAAGMASVSAAVAMSAPAATAKFVAAAGPARMTSARGDKADNLNAIEGIGPAMAKLVNSVRFYRFDQIANLSEADVVVVDAKMKTFNRRITRDKWLAQAKIIVGEGLEAFRIRAKTNDY